MKNVMRTSLSVASLLITSVISFGTLAEDGGLDTLALSIQGSQIEGAKSDSSKLPQINQVRSGISSGLYTGDQIQMLPFEVYFVHQDRDGIKNPKDYVEGAVYLVKAISGDRSEDAGETSMSAIGVSREQLGLGRLKVTDVNFFEGRFMSNEFALSNAVGVRGFFDARLSMNSQVEEGAYNPELRSVEANMGKELNVVTGSWRVIGQIGAQVDVAATDETRVSLIAKANANVDATKFNNQLNQSDLSYSQNTYGIELNVGSMRKKGSCGIGVRRVNFAQTMKTVDGSGNVIANQSLDTNDRDTERYLRCEIKM